MQNAKMVDRSYSGFIRIVYFLLFLGQSLSLAAQSSKVPIFTTAKSLQDSALNAFLSSDVLQQASVGLLIRNLETGEVVASHEPIICRNPASVTKLITTATAIELLGDTFCFHTDIEISGVVEDSVLKGNLYIRGGGDPTLESHFNPVENHFYRSVYDTLRGAGIKRIEGHIIGDASYFNETGSPLYWLVEDIGSSYSPTPSSLSAHDNLINFGISSDSVGFSIVKIRPYTSLLQPKLELTQNGKETAIRISKTDFSWEPTIRGNIPLGVCQYVKTELPEPAYFLADSLRKMLMYNGIRVDSLSSTTRWTPMNPNRRLLYSYCSAPLKDIERITNHKSINLYAENIFLTLSHTKDSLAPSSSWNAASVVAKYWKSKGLASDKIFQVDGSGMSMKNAISPQFLVDLLSYMYNNSPNMSSFMSTLPTAGRSGTVTSFMKGTALEGKAFVKSGSMDRVQNYAGYIHANGKWYAFCIMVSNFSGSRKPVVKQISTLLNQLIAADNNLLKN